MPKRILYLVHRTPYPPNRGHRIRSFHWLEYLSRRCELDVAFIADEPVSAETQAALHGLCRNVFWRLIPPLTRRLQAAWFLLQGKTATAGAFWSSEFSRIIRKWWQAERYDALLVYCSSMARYIDELKVSTEKCYVDLVDVDSQKWADYANLNFSPQSWIYRLESQRLRQVERDVCQRAKVVTLATDPERNLLLSFCPTARAVVVENGVDLDYFRPDFSVEDPSYGIRLTFVGAMDYFPNEDGVCWFLAEVWPVIAKRYPQVTFEIVGAGASARLQRVVQSHERVTLHGEVCDVRPFLKGAIAVVPLRIARGVQNKVLEAMAMGRPVVATPQALEGIKAEIDKEVLRAASENEWIAILAKLIEQEQRRNELGRAARRRIEEDYAWPTKLRVLDDLFDFNRS